MRLFMIVMCFVFMTGCSSGNNNAEDKVVAHINKYKMTVDDLRYEFKNALYDEAELLKTENGRKKYLDGLIDKEILLQEAQRQGIDREKDFMKSIENYWEQALLRILLERRSKEIAGLVNVYDSEIEEYYKNSGEDQPLLKVKDEIRGIIKQKKQTDSMDAWIKELKKRSYVKIYEDALKDAFSNNK